MCSAPEVKAMPFDPIGVGAGMVIGGLIVSSYSAPAGDDHAPAPAATAGSGDYPPNEGSANIRGLPEWIQVGCGDAPYNCPEKGATFAVDGVTPDKMPNLTQHSNFMAEFFVKHPEVYDKLKNKKTS